MTRSLYDAFPYRSRAYPESHVDRCFVIAHLFGMDPVDVAGCRVLEIGCADGGNLVPMAEDLPGARFVGIDLSSRQIEDGRAWLADADPGNVELVAGDALEHLQGTFDYVICHGVYSWVPAPARPRLLSTIRRSLSARGVAFVSYDTLPGWHHRRVVREFILQHAAETDDPVERVEQARALLAFLAESADISKAHGQVLRSHCESLLGSSPQYLIHGLLADVSDPVSFLDFVDAASACGLDYLGDADLGTMTGADLHEAGRSALERLPGGLLAREAVQDTLTMRTFRHSLLVPAGRDIDRRVPWTRVESLWLSSPARRVGGEPPRFAHGGRHHVMSDPLADLALEVLASVWPQQLSFGEWLARVSERRTCRAEELGRMVLPWVASDLVQLHPRDLGVAGVPGARPLCRPWRRQQARRAGAVTDARHRMRDLPPALRWLAARCDGEASRAELAEAARRAAAAGELVMEGTPGVWIEWGLQHLAARGLLARA